MSSMGEPTSPGTGVSAPGPRCTRCGESALALRGDPSIGVGFALLGGLVLADGLRGVWTRGLDTIHAVLGMAYLAAALWGLFADAAHRRRGGDAADTLWLELHGSCTACGQPSPRAADTLPIRACLGVSLLTFGLAIAGRLLG